MYYRLCLLSILYVSATSAAPQNGDSDVTFVKIQPIVEDTAPLVPTSKRESRIENLPLTIPGNISFENRTDADQSENTNEEIIQSTATTDKEETESILTDLTEAAQTRQGKRFESDETTETFEIATEKYEDITEKIVIPKQRKFVSKLGFVKPTFNRYSTNSIEKSGLRRFRSNCRCEKIWNCPKLQISVPRCPNEYFLCCF